MKILSATVSNFASYNHLEFEFKEQGLTLVSGPTGAGKSTLMDIVPWVLFGKTAKGGAVDEILTWGNEGTTEGEIQIEINSVTHTIGRIRSKKSQDLYYDNASSSKHRGKDINDTQKQINNILGFDYSLYMSGAYFHEFSETAQFFTANAKTRRDVTEQIVDLSLATTLSDNSKAYRKKLKIELDEAIQEHSTLTITIKSLAETIKEDTKLFNTWASKKENNLVNLKTKSDNYKLQSSKDADRIKKLHDNQTKALKTELEELKSSLIPEMELTFYRATLTEDKRTFELTKTTKCIVCGSSPGKDKEILLLHRQHELDKQEAANASTKRAIDYKTKELERHLSLPPAKPKVHDNPYAKQLTALQKEENPHLESITARKLQVGVAQIAANDWKEVIRDLETELEDLDLLLEVTDTFRSTLISNTVRDLESGTNEILHDYFDAEIQVEFELTDSDKLSVDISKDGNEATFTQLSKGQRQLLKLAFAVSVMKCIHKHHAISFNCIFLDEFVDGCDDNIKVKAYGLLQSLALNHENIFCIDHSEALKAMFTNRYDVELTDEGSRIEKT